MIAYALRNMHTHLGLPGDTANTLHNTRISRKPPPGLFYNKLGGS